jgi:hypothetical protein
VGAALQAVMTLVQFPWQVMLPEKLRAYYRLQWWWVRVFTTINEFVH